MGKRTKAVLGAAGVGALAVGLSVGPVGAQSDESDAPTSRENRRGAHEERRTEFHAALAAELGISVDRLEAAVEKVRGAEFEARLRQRVEAGDLTEEEADEIRRARRDGRRHEVRAERRGDKIEARIRERVEAGDITQERADRIRERLERGDFPPRGRRGPGRGGPRGDAPGGAGDGPAAVEVDFT